MAKIFKQNLDITEHPNRNNHDLSHKVHGTYKMGYIYPFLCKPVVPNDSFRIDTACGFQLMPMPFPTQSNIRCIFHYFYVRNKNIWENWENWHEGLEEHTPPYIDQSSTFYKTGSLADYLDIPTTIVRNEDIPFASSGSLMQFIFGSQTTGNLGTILYGDRVNPNTVGPVYLSYSALPDTDSVFNGTYFQCSRNFVKLNEISYFSLDYSFPAALLGLDGTESDTSFKNKVKNNVSLALVKTKVPETRDVQDISIADTFYLDDIDADFITIDKGTATVGGESIVTASIQINIFDTASVAEFFGQSTQLFEEDDFFTFGFLVAADSTTYGTNWNEYPSLSYSFQGNLTSPTGIYELSSFNSNPYYGTGNTGDDTQKISALPFRAYESIYYAYYANSILQPMKINGETKYNRYNTTLEDGADATPYHLFQRNWELDAYTSCLPSPQQGDMPLVGITDAGDLRISDPNTGEQSRFHLIQDGDRQTIQVDNVSNPEHSRLALDLVTSGITIPDFREVNAYQRLKEQALRSGYKYKDFVKGNFGISPKQNELDMPEFIGGFSQRVDVNMISNTNGITPDGSSDVLGSFAGQGRAFGGSKHGISHYFDDYGWVIGVMMIVPDCAYSQLLPKHFIYNERLDYYFPQFAQLGLQPITYGEVAPIQSHLQYTGGATNKLLTDVFGYQRPNHEYVWYPDSIHGQIRKSLNNIVINRVFDKRPELSDEFLKIDPKDTDKIFAVTEDDNDVVVGQIAMKITAKRPIPRIVIPTLGR